MGRKLLLILLLCAGWVCTARAEADSTATRYRLAAERAERSFEGREWASAAALYELMLDMRADSADVYSRAIVASAMIPDTAATTDLMQRAMAHGVGLETVLRGVRGISFDIGAPDLYGAYLHRLRASMPWMSRALDHELLRYYIFRDDGPEIVRYARIMLDGLPDSAAFLHALARGYMLQCDMQSAVGVWEKILSLYPDDYDSLLYLGNYYVLSGRRAQAEPYLARALRVRPTPYVEALSADR